ncbi:MAG: Hpt domain-containing protein, partial [Planctomycetes bacterium]|nr:Hpt domain-containing protein [Planctomycetota bacterium]
PIQSEFDGIVGILEIDKKMDDLYHEQHQAMMRMAKPMLFVSLISIFIFYIFARILTQPIIKLTESAKIFGQGNYHIPFRSTAKDEIGVLSDEFEHSRKHISSFINRILDVIPGLLFTCDRDGVMQKHMSTMSKNVLNTAGNDQKSETPDDNVGSALCGQDANFINDPLTFALDPAMDIPWTDAIELAPQEITLKDHIFSMTYVPIITESTHNYNDFGFDKNTIEGVLFFGRDISKQRAIEQAAELQSKYNSLYLSTITQNTLFTDLAQEIAQFHNTCHSYCVPASTATIDKHIIDQLFREIHTIKGNASSLDIFTIAESAHRLESHLADCRENLNTCEHNDNSQYEFKQTGILALEIADEIETEVQRIQQWLIEHIGESDQHQITMSQQEHIQLQKLLQQADHQAAQMFLNSLQQVPLNTYLQNKTRAILKHLCTSLNKEINIDIQATMQRVPEHIIKILDIAVVHILRNAADHGIEDQEQRVHDKKTAEGHIVIQSNVDEHLCKLRISDDGCGIDPTHIKQLILDKGLRSHEECAHLSDRDILQLLFLPGFSSKEQVSDISGRGIGLDAVQSIIKQYHGSIEVQSVIGQGTTFDIICPLIDKVQLDPQDSDSDK